MINWRPRISLQAPGADQVDIRPTPHPKTMKHHLTWKNSKTLAALTAVTVFITGTGLSSAQSEQRGGLLERLRNRNTESSDAAEEATRRFQERNSNSANKPAPAPAPVPAATPVAARTPITAEPVARQRTDADKPASAPVATPVAVQAPAAIAEPVARPVPGAAKDTQEQGAQLEANEDAQQSIASIADGDVPSPEDLKPKFNKAEPEVAEGPVMEITSDESILHNSPEEERMVEFTGDVFLDHPAFNMASDRLEVFLNDEEIDAAPAKEGEKKPPFKRAIATGAMIKIVRINPDGETETAFARRADFDGVTGDVVLSGGPPQLQSGEVHVKPTGTEDKIYLLASGTYRVETATVPTTGKRGVAKLVIPVNGGSDSKTKSPTFLPTQLDDVRTQR